MALYAIFDARPGKAALPVAVAERFSWFAAVLPPVFLLRHGLWLETLAWAAKVVVLAVMARFIGGNAALMLYLLVAVWLGFAAPGLRRHALLSRGWTLRGSRIAASPELAQLGAMS